MLTRQNLGKSRIFAIFRVLEDAFAAPTGGTGGAARCHLYWLGMRYDKTIKTKNFFEKLFFSMTKNREQNHKKTSKFFGRKATSSPCGARRVRSLTPGAERYPSRLLGPSLPGAADSPEPRGTDRRNHNRLGSWSVLR